MQSTNVYISPFLLAFMWVCMRVTHMCMRVCKYHTYVFIWSPPHDKLNREDTWQFYHKYSLSYPLLEPPPSTPLSLLQTITKSFSISIILPLQEWYENEITYYWTFWDWHFSISNISFRSMQFVICINILFVFFLLLYSILWYWCTIIHLTIHLLIDIWLFLILGYYNKKLLWTFTFLLDKYPKVQYINTS